MDDIANSSYEANIYSISEEPSAEDKMVIGIFPGRKEDMNPIPDESLAWDDDTIIGVFPGGKDGMNPIHEESLAGNDETTVGAFPGGKEEDKNPIRGESSLAEDDDTIIGVFPSGKDGMNLIPEESLAGDDETIISVFPGGTESITYKPIPDESSARDETIIGVFPGGNGSTIPIPEKSSAGNQKIIVVYPGENDETDRSYTSHEYPSIENDPSFEESTSSTYKQASPANEEIVIIPGIVPQEWTRKEPKKGAINRGPPGVTH